MKAKKGTHPPTYYPKQFWWWIATWFGCGRSPVMSGTAGSLGALPFAYIIQAYAGNGGLFLASVAIFFMGWWASNRYLRHTGRNDDPSEIVVDEVAGQWLVLSAIDPMEATYPIYPACLIDHSLMTYLLCFILFRLFDISKPWPVSLADRKIKGGLGVMVDDMLAGLYGIGVIFIALLLGFILI